MKLLAVLLSWFVLPALSARAAEQPNIVVSLAADLGSPVIESPPPKFTGWIESVRILSGDPASKPQPKATTP